MFCPKCRTLLYPDGEEMACRRCDYRQPKGKPQVLSRKVETTEQRIIEADESTLPTTTIICEKCGHSEASWVLRQTRAADEPATRIYQCTGCGHKWREY